jgi:hypothetical protein
MPDSPAKALANGLTEGTRNDMLHTVPLSQDVRDSLLIDIHGRTSRIEAKIEVLPEYDDRIGKLERKVWAVPGMGVIAAILAVVGFHPHL